MTTEDFKRKLTAILSADVQGYSRLMGEDEDSTVSTLKAYRELMSSLIERYHGRVVDSPGDNLLSEFESVRDAVRCAFEIQEELRIRNEELPESRKMRFRIGINLGDVIKDGDRIYGDGINVAARVEGLAEGGGISISGTVYDSIKNKLAMHYEFHGEHSVKNIKDPVRVYRIRMEPDAAAPIAKKKETEPVLFWQRKSVLSLGIIVILAMAFILYWKFYPREPSIEQASVEPEQVPAVVSVEEAIKTIAVLPFDDLSPEEDQEYFSVGLAVELRNKLAQVKDLQVTDPTSSFYYRGKSLDMRTIGETLGVTYLLEGSVRKSEDQLRITAQLIKAEDGYQLWSNNYDRELKDIFTIQDDIAEAVSTALSVTLGVGEFSRPGMTRNIEAYDVFLRAYSNLLKITPDSFLSAIDQIKEALDIDPDFGMGWIGLYYAYETGIKILPPARVVDFKARAAEALERARAIAPDMPELLMITSEAFQNSGNWLEAERIFKQIIDEQGHSNADANMEYGLLLLRAGRSSDALQYLQRGKRLNPLGPGISFYLSVLPELNRAHDK